MYCIDFYNKLINIYLISINIEIQLIEAMWERERTKRFGICMEGANVVVSFGCEKNIVDFPIKNKGEKSEIPEVQKRFT